MAKYPHGQHLFSSVCAAQSDSMGTCLKWEGKITKREERLSLTFAVLY